MTLLGHDQAAATVALVAQPPPTQDEDPGGRGEDFGKSSPLGLLVILLFFVAVAFLVRSMTKHLKRIPASFDPPAEDSAEKSAENSSEDSSEEPSSATNGDADRKS